MKLPNVTVSEAQLDTHPSEQAYLELLQEILSIPDDEAERINTDVVYLVNTMLGASDEIAQLRPEIEANFKLFDFERFDRFRTYVLALNHAHALYRASRAVPRELTELVAVVEQRREQLWNLAVALSKFGLLDEAVLAGLKRQPGHRPLASDTLTLVALFKSNWDQIEQKCPLTEQELNQAGSEVLDLQIALGTRERAPTTRHTAALIRRKAYTLFRRVFEPIRRAAIWSRGEEGASEVVPKLTQGNRSGGSAAEEFDPEDAAPEVNNPGAPGVPVVAAPITNSQNLPVSPVFSAE